MSDDKNVMDLEVKGQVVKVPKKSVSYALKAIETHLVTIHEIGGLLTKKDYHEIKDKLNVVKKEYIKKIYGID